MSSPESQAFQEPLYKENLNKLCKYAFSQPKSNDIYDAYLVQMFARTLDAVDALKSEVPILGKREPLNFDIAKKASLIESGLSVKNTIEEIARYLEGMTIWGHSRTQVNVVPPPSIPSLVGILAAALCNPNLAWDKYSHKVALAEVEVVSIMSQLIGYNPEEAGGVFTFGGTGTILYAMKVGLEKVIPDAMKKGVSREDQPVIFASNCSHYSHHNVAAWLGIGTDSVIEISTNEHNQMNIEELRDKARAALKEGKKIVGIICTIGTTDAFGIDDLQAVVQFRDDLVTEFNLSDQNKPHIHADAVIGWVWSVFNNYPWDENPLGFHRRTIHALASAQDYIQHLCLADSVGIDFHKTGFCPCVSSLVLFKEKKNLELLTRKKDDIPYLFDSGEYHPGLYTLETSRSGQGVLAALANLRSFGKDGFQAIIGHLVEMTELLRANLGGHSHTTVLNSENYGTVTLFRVYPELVHHERIANLEFKNSKYRETLQKHNEYNRAIYEYLDREAMAGKGVLLSWTECYRHTSYGNGEIEEKVPALKSYILSPFVDEDSVNLVVDKVLEARRKVGGV